jgi:hypothetical protein
MSPRGFYTRESIHPHFTTQEYRMSEQGRHEAAIEYTIENYVKGLIQYPAKITKSLWLWALLRAGYVKDIDKSP